MNIISNINVGLDEIAKTYLKIKIDPEFKPLLVSSAGSLKSIKLHRYKLKDGTYAEEFLQLILENKNGQNLYFIGLKRNSKTFVWSGEKINKKLKKIFKS